VHRDISEGNILCSLPRAPAPREESSSPDPGSIESVDDMDEDSDADIATTGTTQDFDHDSDHGTGTTIDTELNEISLDGEDGVIP
jgi:hypothetical protein